MLIKRVNERSVLFWLMAVVAALSPAPALPAQIKVVIAADEREPEVGADMNVNAAAIQRSFVFNAPENVYEIHQVPPENFTAGAILDEINRLAVAPDEAVFFYYCGHGAYDPERKTFLLASGDGGRVPLFVSQVREAIEAKGARLSVLIFDCCNTLRPVSGTITLPAPRQRAPGMSPLFKSLFFQTTDKAVLIESSAPGEYAIVLPQVQQQIGQRVSKQNQGSLFTDCLSEELISANLKPKSWSDVCRNTQVRMDRGFGRACPGGRLTLGNGSVVEQNSQNITAWTDGNPLLVR
jgi:hypothetical protein